MGGRGGRKRGEGWGKGAPGRGGGPAELIALWHESMPARGAGGGGRGVGCATFGLHVQASASRKQ